jgi:hypothetical protein
MKIIPYANTSTNAIHSSCAGKFFKQSQHEFLVIAKGNSLEFIPHKKDSITQENIQVGISEMKVITVMTALNVPTTSQDALFIFAEDMSWLVVELSIDKSKKEISCKYKILAQGSLQQMNQPITIEVYIFAI